MRILHAFTLNASARKCRTARALLPEYVDGSLENGGRREVAVHLRECRQCADRQEEFVRARHLLRGLPSREAPAHLNVRLRVMASRESARRRTRATLLREWLFAIEGCFQRARNWMEPKAIPVAGGLVSTLVLFSMLVPTYPGAARVMAGDVPTAFYQQPSVKSIAPFGLCSDEIAVELFLDDNGEVIDYRLPEGALSPHVRSEIENTLLFSRFTPALSFGQRVSGRVRITFRRSQIDVKG
ncbi:MAG: zf-HC2 domain-containing protein [Candidatus Solibacter usitatus]|nr:zf-HC2 domain-containing protein [Candidatus Solibacter usitatus]